jgi:hypothetical protein
VIVNNTTNINKPSNHLSHQIIEHKKDHDIWRWKSRLGQSQKDGGVKPVKFSFPSFALSLSLSLSDMFAMHFALDPLGNLSGP